MNDIAKNFSPDDLIINNVNYNELNDIYNQGHVFVSTSLAEGFNLPCLEAMAAGLPVLTTSYGGQSDFVNNKNGWLLPSGELVKVKDVSGIVLICWFRFFRLIC